MSNRIAITRNKSAAESLLVALVAHKPYGLSSLDSALIPKDGTIPVYTAEDATGTVHVQMMGGDIALLAKVQDFACGFLAAADLTNETQGYEKDQTPMSVSPNWKSDGTGFRE